MKSWMLPETMYNLERCENLHRKKT